MRRDPDCEHKFVDPKSGQLVLPIVNVLAAPGSSGAMTPGRVYCCLLCDRMIDLRARRHLRMPEQPLDLRPTCALPPWLMDEDDEEQDADVGHVAQPERRRQPSEIATPSP
jgi:hypothetical protein